MKRLTAHAIAAPALDVLSGGHPRGTVLGSSSTAAHIDVDGFVVTLTTRTSPLMPNGLVLDQPYGIASFRPGASMRIAPGRMETMGLSVAWSEAECWDPTVPAGDGPTRRQIAERGAAVFCDLRIAPSSDPVGLTDSLAASGSSMAREGAGRAGVLRLMQAAAERSPERASEAAALLLGRGEGLTPDGDDLLGAAAASVCAFGPAVGLAGSKQRAWLEALSPPDVRARTTAISATLIDLALRGLTFEPVGRLLELGVEPEAWRPALRRLLTIGHGTGRAWALGCSATALALAA